uniref:Peptidase C1A papain C-terminal domain-containing protein n=1 Tax=Panagrolaimus davidi TaxID=227884 RepID=A0A914P559_9BILA
MSDEELSEYTNGNPIDEPEFEVNTALSNNAAQKVSIPEYFDYRKLGKVTPVKESHSPHSCGACYAFATAAAIESQYLIHQNLNLDLSEQSLVDCDNHSSKCNGGSVKMNCLNEGLFFLT